MTQPPFLPMTRDDMRLAGWDALDVLLVSGDAYVDHPSFGTALLGRWLAAHGFRVGVAAQPRWRDREAALADLTAMGRPRLFAGVTAGAVDSMLAHYTAFRKKRRDDAYTPGGLAGARPNRASAAYTGLVRQAFPGLPVILGGIEASLRRVSHYDFWDDALRRPLLQDSKADLLVYGMGESALLEIARRAEALCEGGSPAAGERAEKCLRRSGEMISPGPPRHGVPVKGGTAAAGNGGRGREHPAGPDAPEGLLSRAALAEACRDVPGTAWMASPAEARSWLGLDAGPPEASPRSRPGAGENIPKTPAKPVLFLPSHEAILAEPALLMRAALDLEKHAHAGHRYALQESGGRALVLAPPAAPLPREDLDRLHGLPYSRLPHPRYKEPVPAWEMIRASITTHRGCGGGCAFCSLALHQGRRVTSRSAESILSEAALIAAGSGAAGREARPAKGGKKSPTPKAPPRWAGSISDVGGPSANMWQAACALPPDKECARPSCLHPAPCPLFQVDQGLGVRLLRAVAALPGVRHVRVASGVRFDLALRDPEALRAYTSEFTGGQLKTAPEHSRDAVLGLMRKPGLATFERFLEAFARHCRETGKEQYVIPYLMSAHPGCTDADMRALAAWLKKRGWRPRQVQCFIPTPGTVATAMYYAGISPDGAPIHVARTDSARLRQHRLLIGEDQGKDAETKRRDRKRGKKNDAAKK